MREPEGSRNSLLLLIVRSLKYVGETKNGRRSAQRPAANDRSVPCRAFFGLNNNKFIGDIIDNCADRQRIPAGCVADDRSAVIARVAIAQQLPRSKIVGGKEVQPSLTISQQGESDARRQPAPRDPC